MCCCGKPTINGEPNAYSWDGKTFTTRPIDPPAIEDGDAILFDQPGRCGGVDSHSHHFRVVKAKFGGYFLLVRHGAGDERISLGYRAGIVDAAQTLALHSPISIYWLLQSFYHAQSDLVRAAKEETNAKWRKAAAEKRIKTRKYPSRGVVKVWIDSPQSA